MFSTLVLIRDLYTNLSFRFGNYPPEFVMDDVRCTGSESDIMQCPHSTTDNCGSNEGAGVRCGGET